MILIQKLQIIKYLKNLKIHNLNLQKINVSKSIIEKYDRTNSTSNLILSNEFLHFYQMKIKKFQRIKVIIILKFYHLMKLYLKILLKIWKFNI